MTFHELKEMHGVTEEVDAIFVSDGSGTVRGNPCGYAVYVHFVGDEKGAWLEGGSTTGTNNLAEISPFLLALWHYEGQPFGKSRIACVTDSEVTVNCAVGKYSRSANLGLWASYDYYVGQQYKFYWYWKPRRSTVILAECDDRAGTFRKRLN